MPRWRWQRGSQHSGGWGVWCGHWGRGGRGKQGGSDRVYVCVHTRPSTHTQGTIQSPRALDCLSSPASQASFLLPGVCSRTLPHQDQLLMKPSKSVGPSEGWRGRQGAGKRLTLITSHPSFMPAMATEMNSKQPKRPERESPSPIKVVSTIAHPGRGRFRGFQGAGEWLISSSPLSTVSAMGCPYSLRR